MGTWGTAVFSDDLAADIRNEWRTLIGDGLSGPEATQRLVHDYAEALSDSDERSVFWIALALTQHRAGRVEQPVVAAALKCITDGSGLARWQEDPKALRQRTRVLDKVRQELESPPPPPKRIPRVYRNATEWELGEFVGYALRSGSWVVFRNIAFHSDAGGTSPIVELLDWVGPELPTAAQCVGFGVRPDMREHLPRHDRVWRLMIGATSARERPDSRLRRLGVAGNPPAPIGRATGAVVFPWRYLDKLLAEYVDLH